MWAEVGPGDHQEAAAALVETAELVRVSPTVEETARTAFETTFGRHVGVFLVRPDGYVGVATGESSAARQLATYRERWLSNEEKRRAA